MNGRCGNIAVYCLSITGIPYILAPRNRAECISDGKSNVSGGGRKAKLSPGVCLSNGHVVRVGS